MNQLEQLKKHSTIVADSGDFEAIKAYRPTDATTNPSLILAASQKEIYAPLVHEAISFAKKEGVSPGQTLEIALEKLFVNFGIEILKIVPGRVSIEVDARLSFDVEKSVKKARRLIKYFEDKGIDRSRILIKLATTWEGVVAAKELEKENIHCNMTLLFSKIQAIAAAEANAKLISPFVGRILDWYIKNGEKKEFSPSEDPGVLSVKAIYNYYKKFEYPTEIMAASFRNKDQITELCGCDLLTIAPSLLEELKQTVSKTEQKLSREMSQKQDLELININENTFRYFLNDDQMATEKLSEGIRRFASDMIKLENIIKKAL
jgi:transaldolase